MRLVGEESLLEGADDSPALLGIDRATLPDVEIVEDGITGTLVRDGDFAAALNSVPAYDPAVLASRAERFSLEHYQACVQAVWAPLAAHRTGAG